MKRAVLLIIGNSSQFDEKRFSLVTLERIEIGKKFLHFFHSKSNFQRLLFNNDFEKMKFENRRVVNTSQDFRLTETEKDITMIFKINFPAIFA